MTLKLEATFVAQLVKYIFIQGGCKQFANFSPPKCLCGQVEDAHPWVNTNLATLNCKYPEGRLLTSPLVVEALASALKSSNLKRLELMMEPEAVASILQALCSHKKMETGITELSLKSCRLAEVGANAVALALQVSSLGVFESFENCVFHFIFGPSCFLRGKFRVVPFSSHRRCALVVTAIKLAT